MIGHRTKHRRESAASVPNERLHRIRSAARYRELVKAEELDELMRNELHNLAVYLGRDDETVKADRAAAMKVMD